MQRNGDARVPRSLPTTRAAENDFLYGYLHLHVHATTRNHVTILLPPWTLYLKLPTLLR